jgi:hypothetical protein
VAYVPSKAIDDGAGLVDQSPTAQFIAAHIIIGHQPRRLVHHDRRLWPDRHSAEEVIGNLKQAGEKIKDAFRGRGTHRRY